LKHDDIGADRPVVFGDARRLLITSKESIRPLQLGLAVFVNADNNDPQLLMAASVFTILPIIIFYFVAQRQFIEGIASSGLKG
jgi:multiple sugar transport system permease protein